MKFKKIMSLFLSMLLLLGALAACKDTTGTPTDTTSEHTQPPEETTGTVIPSNPERIDLISGGKSEWKIYYNTKDADAKAFADILVDRISSATGVTLAAWSSSSIKDGEKTITVGEVGTAHTSDVATKTERGNFSVTFDANTLALYAKGSVGYLELENYVKAVLLANSEKGKWSLEPFSLLNGADGDRHSHSVAKDGTKKYYLVYNKDTENAFLYMAQIANYIKNACGVSVIAIPDSKENSNGTEILFGNTSRPLSNTVDAYLRNENDWALYVGEEDIAIAAKNEFSTLCGLVALCQTIAKSEGKTAALKTSDNLYGNSDELEKGAQLMEMASLYRKLHGTYGSWIDKIIDQLKAGKERDEILLCEALVARLGTGSFAVKTDSASVLFEGYVQKLDPADYSRTAKRENGAILIPADFAKLFFGESVTVNAEGYVDLSALCQASDKYTLSYSEAHGIAVCTPKEKASYSDLNASVEGYTNQKYLDCMQGFFENTLLPEPSTNTEQSRVELAGSPYESEYVYDYTQASYEVNASPTVMTVTEGGKEVLYATYQSYTTLNDLSEHDNVVYLKKSTDAGKTWTTVTTVNDLRWQTLTQVNGVFYLIGSNAAKARENKMLVASYDPASGKTTSKTFALNLGGGGPCAYVVHDGRLYVAFNRGVVSIDISKDLLKEANWTVSTNPNTLMTKELFTEALGRSITQFSMEEGNIVLGKDGELYAVYRVNAAPSYGRAIVFALSKDGKTLSLIDNSIIKFPSSQSKFSIKYDAKTGLYLSVVSLPTEHASHQRNVLALAVSEDLFTWTVVDTLLVDRQMLQFNVSRHKHGLQYADFDVIGNDLVFIIRESSGDKVNKWHDGTYITMYTVSDYAALIERALANGGLDIDLDAAYSNRPAYGLQ